MAHLYWNSFSVEVDLDDLPEVDQRARSQGLVKFGSVTPAQLPLDPKVAAGRHEELALDHLAAAKWLREQPEPPKVITRRYKSTVKHEEHSEVSTLSGRQFTSAESTLIQIARSKGLIELSDVEYLGSEARRMGHAHMFRIQGIRAVKEVDSA